MAAAFAVVPDVELAAVVVEAQLELEYQVFEHPINKQETFIKTINESKTKTNHSIDLPVKTVGAKIAQKLLVSFVDHVELAGLVKAQNFAVVVR